MPIRALLFDLDGTLVRTNDAHVGAWLDALAAFRYRVGRRRVEEEIGKGGDLLVPSVLGRDVEEAEGEALREARAPLFRARLEREGVTFFDGVDALFAEVRRRGLHTAIATSASPEDLEIIERLSGRRLAEMADVVTGKQDAAVSKPAPDILHAACDRLGEDPLACMMIGDSLHDANAARAAGMACTGVTTGYVDEAGFVQAGARFVTRDVQQLAASMGEALSAASRSQVRFDEATLGTMMSDALGAAREGLARREMPVGAALFGRDGRLLATAHDRARETGDATAHASMEVIRRLAGRGETAGEGTTLVSTLEPCVMCLGAAIEAGADVVVYGLPAPADGGTSRVAPLRNVEYTMPRIRGGVAAGEARSLLAEWLAEGGAAAQRPLVERLLAGRSA